MSTRNSSQAAAPGFLDLPRYREASGTLRLPGSKSISNRTLLLSALAEGTTRLAGLLDSDDTRVMLEALAKLGVRVDAADAPGAWRVEGRPDGFPVASAELYLGNPKNMGNQLKYADRRNSPCVIIQGSDEKARGEVQIKDLIEGAKAAAAIASNQEWRETRPAQFSCREDEIVARVREVLARHDVTWG